MTQDLQPVRGTKDLIADEARAYEFIVKKALTVFETYGFEPIYTPIFEFTEVFKRSLGDYSDVVNKEMYSFDDRGNESLTLRPEFTAGIARAYISNGLAHKSPLRLYSHGPLFRYERPQKGRQRQFHQLNIEALGIASPQMDGEIVQMGAAMLEALGVLDKTVLNINSLGCSESRASYVEAITTYFSKYKNDLSDDSKVRLQKNPLRILDSKDETDIKLGISAPVIGDYYTEESKRFFGEVLEFLDLTGVKYNVNPRLVRGLDYYSHTAFEFITTHLGAQGTVLGGGRYDGLISLMGGQQTPGIGFAAGIERLALLINEKITIRPNVIINFLAEKEAIILAKDLRENGICIINDYDINSAKKMKRANKINAKLAFFIGEDEIKLDIVKIKDLDTGEEIKIPRSKIVETAKKILAI